MTIKRTLLGTLTGVLFIMAVTLLPVESLNAQDAADTAPADPPSFVERGGDTGDTAWMIVATALVLFMTIPGLSLFYGGLVRGRNILSILVQCFAITCLMSILWVAYGYSLSAEVDKNGNYFGGFDQLF